MNKKAQTHELTKESNIGQCFSKEQNAIQYIRSSIDFNKFFVIRKRVKCMVNSYSCKNSIKMWIILNGMDILVNKKLATQNCLVFVWAIVNTQKNTHMIQHTTNFRQH